MSVKPSIIHQDWFARTSSVCVWTTMYKDPVVCVSVSMCVLVHMLLARPSYVPLPVGGGTCCEELRLERCKAGGNLTWPHQGSICEVRWTGGHHPEEEVSRVRGLCVCVSDLTVRGSCTYFRMGLQLGEFYFFKILLRRCVRFQHSGVAASVCDSLCLSVLFSEVWPDPCSLFLRFLSQISCGKLLWEMETPVNEHSCTICRNSALCVYVITHSTTISWKLWRTIFCKFCDFFLCSASLSKFFFSGSCSGCVIINAGE